MTRVNEYEKMAGLPTVRVWLKNRGDNLSIWHGNQETRIVSGWKHLRHLRLAEVPKLTQGDEVGKHRITGDTGGTAACWPTTNGQRLPYRRVKRT